MDAESHTVLVKFNSLKLLRLRFSTYQASGCCLVYLNMTSICLGPAFSGLWEEFRGYLILLVLVQLFSLK